MEKSYNDFKKKILKFSDNRKSKIKGSLGVYDAYKWVRKNKWLDIGKPITEHEFYSIIRRVNQYLALNLINGIDVKLPNKMGILELRKYDSSIRIINGKIKTNLPVNWDRTLKLWYEDEEAYKNKTLVKMEEKEIFKIHYNKLRANYNNKSFYDFKVNRELKKRLKNSIKEGKIDAFIL